MKENKFGSLAMLEERLSDIVELYKDGKIDDMQFRALKHQEFDWAYYGHKEDIENAFMSGYYDGNLKKYDNEEDLINESYKNAEAYYEKTFKNKTK